MITHAALGTWCDTCKMAWGQLKDKSWHPKAQNQALVISTSNNGQQRAYCRACLYEISRGWGKNKDESWPLEEQMSMAAGLNLARLRARLSEVAHV